MKENLVHAADYSCCCPTRPPFSSEQSALARCTGDCTGTTGAAVGFLVGFHPAATHMPRLTLEDLWLAIRQRSRLFCSCGVWDGLALLEKYLPQV